MIANIVRDIGTARAVMAKDRDRVVRAIGIARASPVGAPWVDRLSVALRDLDADPQVSLLADLASILSGDAGDIDGRGDHHAALAPKAILAPSTSIGEQAVVAATNLEDTPAALPVFQHVAGVTSAEYQEGIAIVRDVGHVAAPMPKPHHSRWDWRTAMIARETWHVLAGRVDPHDWTAEESQAHADGCDWHGDALAWAPAAFDAESADVPVSNSAPDAPPVRVKSANGRRYKYDGAQCDAIRADRAAGASWDELAARWECGRNTLKAIVGRTGKWASIGTPETAPPTVEPDDDAGIKVEKAFETPEWAVDVQTRDDKFSHFIFYQRAGRDWAYVEAEESVPVAIRDRALDYYEERWEEDAAAG